MKYASSDHNKVSFRNHQIAPNNYSSNSRPQRKQRAYTTMGNYEGGKDIRVPRKYEFKLTTVKRAEI